MQKADDEGMSVREILSELALDRVFGVKQIRAMNAGTLRTAVFIVPNGNWIDPIATALDGLVERVSVFRRKDGKRSDEDGDYAKGKLASRPVVFVAGAPSHIPVWFLNSAESFVKLPDIDNGLVAALIRRVCRGRLPKRFDELDVSVLDFDEVGALVAPNTSATATLQRLADAIDKKRKPPAPSAQLPDFVEAVEFGEAHGWGLQLKQDLDDYRRGVLGWEDVDRGVLLHGPPGGGKTLYAKALANFLGVPLVQLNMSNLFSTSGYLDAVVRGQRQAFEDAKSKKPCLMFIDEIDQVPDLDRTSDRNRDYWSVVVADLLMALDGNDAGREGVVVIGATNRPNAIAPALKRPGRLEREIYLGPAGPDGIARIIRFHGGPTLADADLGVAAQICHGRRMTAAEVMEMARSARRIARKNGRPTMIDDVMEALLSSDDWPAEAMRRISIHEAGHCLVGLLMTPESLSSVSLSIDHGSFTSFDMSKSRIVTADVLRRHLLVLLGGRQAELLFFGDIGTGSGGSRNSDLGKASALSAAMLTSYGFEAPTWRAEPDDVYDLLGLDPILRAAVQSDLVTAATEVDAMLSLHRPAVLALADALLERRFLDVESMRTIAAASGVEFKAVVQPDGGDLPDIDS